MFLVGVCLLSSNLVFAARLREKRVPFDVPGSQLPVYVVEGIPSPCLMGIIKPAIYLTPQAAAMEEGLDAVLAHERTHNSHCDEIWAILRGICLAIHWYNPLVWLAVILSRRDGELACDEGTTEDMTEEERLNYGRTLIHLAVAQPRLDSLFYIATTMTGSAKELEERVRSIADRFRTTAQTKALVAVVMVLAVMVTFTAASTTAGEMPVVQRRGGGNLADADPE